VTFASSMFATASLRDHPRGEAVQRILSAALDAVEPNAAIRRMLWREGNQLFISGQAINLMDFRRIVVISIGKAAVGMAASMGDLLGDRLDIGLIVAKASADRPPPKFTLVLGGHPIPNESSVKAGRAVLDLASSLAEGDLLFCLVSGGGSALVAAPVGGVSLPDLQSLTASLLACGARIDEINAVRRTLDAVKGGGLARAVRGAHIITLVVSDVVGNPPETVASGPTVPARTSRAAAMAILLKYDLQERIPGSIRSFLEAADAADSGVKEEPPRGELLLIGSNMSALQGALKQAQSDGFHPHLLRADLEGEASALGQELASALRWEAQRADPVSRPACLVAGGETTVTVHGDGRGGRNTELALAAAIALADFPNVMLVTLASDGEDGPTDAAGAVVTGDTFRRARAQGMDPSDYLNRNDSYSFFAALGDLLRPGPTGTNVADLVVMFAF
jgi:glycerate 2-kinase